MKIIRIERVRDEEPDHGSSRWLVGFTDLTTLLLAFFILLFSTAQVKNATWLKASQSMRASFNSEKQITQAPGQPGQAHAEKTWDSIEREAGLDVTYLNSLVRKLIGEDPALQQLETHMENDAVLISLPADMAFDSGSDRMSERGEAIIARLEPFLSRLPNSVEIIGHADPEIIDAGGAFGSNWHLSLARAFAVAQELNHQGYAQRVTIRGRGASDTDLLPKNLPIAVRNAKARRVDIRLQMVQPDV